MSSSKFISECLMSLIVFKCLKFIFQLIVEFQFIYDIAVCKVDKQSLIHFSLFVVYPKLFCVKFCVSC